MQRYLNFLTRTVPRVCQGIFVFQIFLRYGCVREIQCSDLRRVQIVATTARVPEWLLSFSILDSSRVWH